MLLKCSPDRDIGAARVVRKSASQRRQRSERRRQTEKREGEETVDLVRRMLFQKNSKEDKQAAQVGGEQQKNEGESEGKGDSSSKSGLWIYWQVLGGRELIVGLDQFPTESVVRDLWNLGLSKLASVTLAPIGRASGARKK